MRRAAVLMSPLLIAGCLSGGGHDRPGPRPVALDLPTSAETRACFADLRRQDVRYSPLPDRDHGGGCRVVGAVQLLDIGVPATGLTAMRCGLAAAFTGWVRNAVAPAARQLLGSDLARVETFGTYSCRPVAGTGRLSGHAIANAVDVSGFVLADGRRITVLGDWRSGDERVERFLQTVRASACRRFGTVLSPDYNAAHADHLHLEDDGAAFCR